MSINERINHLHEVIGYWNGICNDKSKSTDMRLYGAQRIYECEEEIHDLHEQQAFLYM